MDGWIDGWMDGYVTLKSDALQTSLKCTRYCWSICLYILHVRCK